MYYNSNSDDYYNSYKKELAELEAYRKEDSIHKIFKLILSFLSLVLLMFAAFYLYKYFNPSLNNQQSKPVLANTKNLPTIVIREEGLPTSIQLTDSHLETGPKSNTPIKNMSAQEGTELISTMNEKEIALIVQIIMSQMNSNKELSLEEQLKQIANKKFENKSLKESNHYNKVVLTQNQTQKAQSNSLMELSNQLTSIINEGTNLSSNYSNEIKKEMTFRENEMRIIIVQKGDTLSKIAKKAYGSYDQYPKIFAANPEIIKNPNQIFVGQRLRIPV